MKLKKPKFWDYKKPNYLSYLLLPFTLPLLINNFYLSQKNTVKKNITTICVGNIYIGGTAKTPLTIKIDQILNNLNFKTVTIKKFYKDQNDEQELLNNKTKLYCFKKRTNALDAAIKDGADIAVFDDGLQDGSINYDLNFICFNNLKWIGNGFLIPAGPLREKIQSISKYDAIFLNGNEENTDDLKLIIKKYNSNIKIFETYYMPNNISKFDKNDKFITFSGIGNPESFTKTLIKNGFNIINELKFPDHYQYTLNDINKIKSHAKKLNAKIITTEKDYVKIDSNQSNEISFLGIDIVIKQEEKLINFIKSKI
tara:strand:- start:665 stop:1600 length:936 start_codon:yes stop_codon:yes gene_type:complete